MLNITPDTLDDFFTNNAPYLVHLDGKQICADPRNKGGPGDTVLVWPKKRGPLVLRRLARNTFDQLYYFADGEEVVSVPAHKVAAIHKVVV